MVSKSFLNHRTKFILVFTFSVFSLLFFTDSLLGLTVDFKNLVEVRGEKLTIGDIASISPEYWAKKLKDKALFSAPDPGENRRYKAETLKAYVRELIPEEDIDWTGADVVEVRQKGQLIGKKMMVGIVESYIREQLSKVPESQIKFEVRSMPEPFTLPYGQVDYEIIPSSPSIVDSRQFTVIFRINGDVVKNIRVRGKIKAYDKVAVTRYQLDRNHLIEKDDIKMAAKDITSCDNPVLKKKEVLGKRVKRSLYPGQIIERRWLERPNLVERGQMITMYISKGPLLISALGVACSDAKRGQIIKVKNVGSEKRVYCKVVSSDRALVEY